MPKTGVKRLGGNDQGGEFLGGEASGWGRVSELEGRVGKVGGYGLAGYNEVV